MQAKLTYAIKYVADMDKAVAFRRDVLGLKLRFPSPEWSEFDTGETTLALHKTTPEHPAGTAQLGFGLDDLQGFYAARDKARVTFTAPPVSQHGALLARMLDSEGAEISLSGR